jgi:hypothetical protein
MRNDKSLSGVVIWRNRFDELRERLLPLLRALRTGIQRYYDDKNFAIKVISKYNKETDPDAGQVPRVLPRRRLQA